MATPKKNQTKKPAVKAVAKPVAKKAVAKKVVAKAAPAKKSSKPVVAAKSSKPVAKAPAKKVVAKAAPAKKSSKPVVAAKDSKLSKPVVKKVDGGVLTSASSKDGKLKVATFKKTTKDGGQVSAKAATYQDSSKNSLVKSSVYSYTYSSSNGKAQPVAQSKKPAAKKSNKK